MKQDWIGAARIAAPLIVGLLVVDQIALAQEDKPKMIHDSEYYILEAQHGARWSVEDKDLDQKLVELRQKFGTPPNIIHIMFDDTPVGEVGISFIQKQRGWETPERVPARQAGKIGTRVVPGIPAGRRRRRPRA